MGLLGRASGLAMASQPPPQPPNPGPGPGKDAAESSQEASRRQPSQPRQEVLDVLGQDLYPAAMVLVLLLLNMLKGVRSGM